MADTLPAPVRRAQPRTVPRTVPGTVTGPSVYYRYTYNTYTPDSSRFGTGYPPPPEPGSTPGTRSRIGRGADFINRHSGTFNRMGNVPRGLPRFLGSRSLLFVTWLLSMVLISSNEVNNGFIPPRPLRLWYASLVYFVLFLVSQVDSMVPVCNALGIGYVVTLGYENISGNAFTLFGIPVSGSTGGYGAEAGGLIAQGAGQIAKSAKNLFGKSS